MSDSAVAVLLRASRVPYYSLCVRAGLREAGYHRRLQKSALLACALLALLLVVVVSNVTFDPKAYRRMWQTRDNDANARGCTFNSRLGSDPA
jgi:hypothetical protein